MFVFENKIKKIRRGLANDRFQDAICIFKRRGSVIYIMLLHGYDLVEYWEVVKEKQ